MNINDSGQRSTFETGAQRDDGGNKPRPSLMSIPALIRYSQQLADGAKKYSDRNWEKGMPLSRYVDALMRHLFAWMNGHNDENHLGAIMFNAAGLAHTYDLIRAGRLPASLNDLPGVDMAGDPFPLEDLYLYPDKSEYDPADVLDGHCGDDDCDVCNAEYGHLDEEVPALANGFSWGCLTCGADVAADEVHIHYNDGTLFMGTSKEPEVPEAVVVEDMIPSYFRSAPFEYRCATCGRLVQKFGFHYHDVTLDGLLVESEADLTALRENEKAFFEAKGLLPETPFESTTMWEGYMYGKDARGDYWKRTGGALDWTQVELASYSVVRELLESAPNARKADQEFNRADYGLTEAEWNYPDTREGLSLKFD